MNLLKYDQYDRGRWYPRHPFVAVHDCFLMIAAIVIAVSTDSWDRSFFIVVALMYAASAFHHWQSYAVWHHRLDRAMIYLLIGGTVLPYVQQVQMLEKGWALFVLGAAVILGITLKVFGIAARKGYVATALYSVTGLCSVYCMLGVAGLFGTTWAILFWMGVCLYLLQMISYNLNWFDLLPRKFGVREVQHLILLVAFLDHAALAVIY